MGSTCAMPECMSAFYLLEGASLDESQRSAVMAAAPPKDELLTPRFTNVAFLRAVTYESVACVLRQLDNKSKLSPVGAALDSSLYPSDPSPNEGYEEIDLTQQGTYGHSYIHAPAPNGRQVLPPEIRKYLANILHRGHHHRGQHHRNNGHNRNQRGCHTNNGTMCDRGSPASRMTHDEIKDRNATQACMCCCQIGHWYSDQYHNGRKMLTPGPLTACSTANPCTKDKTTPATMSPSKAPSPSR